MVAFHLGFEEGKVQNPEPFSFEALFEGSSDSDVATVYLEDHGT